MTSENPATCVRMEIMKSRKIHSSSNSRIDSGAESNDMKTVCNLVCKQRAPSECCSIGVSVKTIGTHHSSNSSHWRSLGAQQLVGGSQCVRLIDRSVLSIRLRVRFLCIFFNVESRNTQPSLNPKSHFRYSETFTSRC
jgi:hypothetical protein